MCGTVGIVLGALATLVIVSTLLMKKRAYRRQHGKRTAESQTDDIKVKKPRRMPSLKQITNFLFITTQVSALIWVFTSYGIALYSTIKLGQVYTMSETADPAINTLLGVVAMKVVANIFEHNEGPIFGTSKNTNDDTEGVG